MDPESIYILGIESSCDDTSAAVLSNETELSNVVAGQNLIHKFYGGVVPELASRAHQQKIIPVVAEALSLANINKNQVHGLAFTRGPGLMGSLLVGVSFAKSFALALGIPILEVNHLQAHVLSHFIRKPGEIRPVPDFPFLCLTVSGGHTQIVLVSSRYEMKIIGETLDDAAGEAFDKGAKILGIPYPGGPLIDEFSESGDPFRFSFPHPRINGLDFSFSGLKTSFLYFIRDQVKLNPEFIKENIADICASYQHTIVMILCEKLKKAVEETGIRQIALAGGVSANRELRKTFLSMAKSEGLQAFIPPFEHCTDNAAMIAIAGYFKFLQKDFASQEIVPLARMPF